MELLKESSHYLVASIPGHAAALGFAASRDQNTFGIDAGMRFAVGQTVQATIAALPDAATGMLTSCAVCWEPSKAVGLCCKCCSQRRPSVAVVAARTVNPLTRDIECLQAAGCCSRCL